MWHKSTVGFPILTIDAGDLRSFWLLNRAAVSILKHALVLTHPFTVEIISEAQRVGHMLGFSRFYFQLSSMAHSSMWVPIILYIQQHLALSVLKFFSVLIFRFCGGKIYIKFTFSDILRVQFSCTRHIPNMGYSPLPSMSVTLCCYKTTCTHCTVTPATSPHSPAPPSALSLLLATLGASSVGSSVCSWPVSRSVSSSRFLAWAHLPLSLFFGRTMRRVGAEFPDQGLKPGLWHESLAS